ncbi:MAG: hypothetical protein K0Q59_4017 [Paenibacillus sp.]|jgi:hypothetical protein|nr:hypothetical protein [Paenibacillus sp.]
MNRDESDDEVDIASELERKLQAPPLKGGKRFNHELRSRIEQRIDSKSKYTRSWIMRISMLSAIPLLLAILASFSMHREPPALEMATQEPLTVDMPDTVEPELFSGFPELPSFTSGLLIGLRTDGRETTYRTIYIAPRKEVPAVVSQGTGILVPYKREFWKIDTLHYETVTDRYDFFTAHPADQRPTEARKIGPSLFRDAAEEKVIHSEKLLFAANEYVSIMASEEVTSVSSGAAIAGGKANQVWTTKIPSLTGSRQSVTLNDVFAGEVSLPDYLTNQWYVARSFGRWIPMAASDTPSAAGASADAGTLGADYRKIDVQLPKSVVNHDDSCCSRSDISQRFPNAKDVFSSPDNDMTVVNSDGRLLVFGSPRELSGEPALTIKLTARETVVMAQWATGHYVEEWAVKTAALLR